MIRPTAADLLRMPLDQPVGHQSLNPLPNRRRRDTRFGHQVRNPSRPLPTQVIQQHFIRRFGLAIHAGYSRRTISRRPNELGRQLTHSILPIGRFLTTHYLKNTIARRKPLLYNGLRQSITRQKSR